MLLTMFGGEAPSASYSLSTLTEGTLLQNAAASQVKVQLQIVHFSPLIFTFKTFSSQSECVKVKCESERTLKVNVAEENF